MPHDKAVEGFRTWKSFAEDEEGGLASAWAKAVVQLCLTQHFESAKVDSIGSPEFDDPVLVFHEAASKKKLLPWWPEKIERVLLKVRVTPTGETSDSSNPPPIDPNNQTLGLGSFVNQIVQSLERFGEEFSGDIEIRIMRATDKSVLGGFRKNELFVGVKPKKKRGSSGGETNDALTEFLLERDKETRADMGRMFAHSSNVIAASAAVVNATRGVNAAPPWMSEGDANPMWMALVQGALGIGGSLLTGKNPADQIKQMMSEPVHPMLGGEPSGRQGQGQNLLTDRGGKPSGPTYGSDQFLEDGEYDGFHVVEDDLLDDGFDEDFGDDDDQEWEEDDDSEEEEEEDEPPRRSRKKGGGPLDGLNDEEVEQVVNKWMDSKDKQTLRAIGTRLASKILR